ncbi:uncharacterized protein LOC121377584 [Gigantopelta aegis]|uniref:uncharacterized protein LOC121377584 n=1 Tax=Gigantopelta aegis TaxID=1735272 RepID=UPI001B88A171|nr:uncharacterized protein LOC121377584 [Gigantopelta aegis]
MNVRPGRDREMAAVTFNQKEQRCLERAMKTLHLEYCYQLKLLDLDHRVIRVNYKRLKDKVTKIKSYLSAEEIHSLRKLDSEGKIKLTCNSVNLSGTLKIAAAAKRLKCFPSGHKVDRVVSADSRLIGRDGQSEPLASTPVANNTRRCNSVTGVFTDAPILNKLQRRESSDLGFITTGVTRPRVATLNDGQRSVSSRVRQSTNRVYTPSRRYTSTDTEPNKSISSRPDTCTSGYVTLHSHSPFSSHSAAEKDAARLMTEPFRPQREMKSFPCDESIDSNFGDDLYEERRQELLEDELSRAAELEIRKNRFLKSVDNYLHVAPSTLLPKDLFQKQDSKRPATVDSQTETIADNGRLLTRRLRVDFDETPTYLPEEEYRKRLLDLWTDMNKCRYLRVPDELIDLSGIRTLATEQIRLFDSLRTSGYKTFAASAEV